MATSHSGGANADPVDFPGADGERVSGKFWETIELREPDFSMKIRPSLPFLIPFLLLFLVSFAVMLYPRIKRRQRSSRPVKKEPHAKKPSSFVSRSRLSVSGEEFVLPPPAMSSESPAAEAAPSMSASTRFKISSLIDKSAASLLSSSPHEKKTEEGASQAHENESPSTAAIESLFSEPHADGPHFSVEGEGAEKWARLSLDVELIFDEIPPHEPKPPS